MVRSLPGDDRDDFASALTQLTIAGPADDLCGPFVRAVGVSGAVISTLGPPLGTQTICASSPVGARIDEIQIDLGEGPCWEALRTRRPVLESDMRGGGGDGWPAAREAFRVLDIGALYAFPLFVGALGVGVVDLYSQRARELSARDVEDVTVLAAIASRHLLRRALDDIDSADEGMVDAPHSRREVHQASGMVAAQLRISVDDAMLVLRSRAFSSGATVAAIAADVVARRITFTP